MGATENKRLMQTLDDAWNSQDWETFKKRHTENTAVHWPGQPEPTQGRLNHEAECKEFFKTFPDNHIANRPYRSSSLKTTGPVPSRRLHGDDEGPDEPRWREGSSPDEQALPR